MTRIRPTPTARSIKEWAGITPDSVPPKSVELRIFDRHGGRCYLTGVKLLRRSDWQLDHIVALRDGGLNVESNLAPIWVGAHREKTAQENTERSKVNRIRQKHLGLWESKTPMRRWKPKTEHRDEHHP